MEELVCGANAKRRPISHDDHSAAQEKARLRQIPRMVEFWRYGRCEASPPNENHDMTEVLLGEGGKDYEGDESNEDDESDEGDQNDSPFAGVSNSKASDDEDLSSLVEVDGEHGAVAEGRRGRRLMTARLQGQ